MSDNADTGYPHINKLPVEVSYLYLHYWRHQISASNLEIDTQLTFTLSQLTQRVASFIDSFTDLINFTLVHKQFNYSVHSSQSGGLWVQLFANQYDVPPGKLGRDLKPIYKSRNMLIDKLVFCIFNAGLTTLERDSLEMIRDLIVGMSHLFRSLERRRSFLVSSLPSTLLLNLISKLYLFILLTLFHSQHWELS